MSDIDQLRESVRQAKGRLHAAEMMVKCDEEFPDRSTHQARNAERVANRKADLAKAEADLARALESNAV